MLTFCLRRFFKKSCLPIFFFFIAKCNLKNTHTKWLYLKLKLYYLFIFGLNLNNKKKKIIKYVSFFFFNSWREIPLEKKEKQKKSVFHFYLFIK